MPKIYIDNRPYIVADDQNLLQACLSLGFDIPYFCWHPAMGSVGACRQCAVKQFRDENDQKGRIVMACMTPASEGTMISIDDPEAKKFRASVIEWLMVNHPHDCPVCDEGGECHLQDMTVMTGHNYRRYRFNKRTHRNQDLGPFINHEMNRCIQCYRCVRFYRDYAGGRDLNVFACHDHVYFGRAEDGVLENPFAGNLVEICPTGVFTDKTFRRHYTRKWDLQSAPSVCVHCSLGCNTLPGERYGALRRIRNRYHHAINGYFLCDRGRYGYEFVNSARRIRQPHRRMRKKNALRPVPADIALAMAGALIRKNRPVLGIGSPRASLEANFMLRMLVGPEHFYAGVNDEEWRLTDTALRIMQQGPADVTSLEEAARADGVFVLGENVSDSAPLLDLRLRRLIHVHAARVSRQSRIPAWNDAGIREVAQQEKETLFIATPGPTRLDGEAKLACRAHPDDLTRLGFGVAALLDPAAPAVADLPDELRVAAAEIAAALKTAERPMVVAGIGSGNRGMIEAAANITRALAAKGSQARLLYTFPECNSAGMGLLGSRGGVDSAFQAMQKGAADTVIVLENDIFRRMDTDRAEAFFNTARYVICLDHLQHATAERCDLLLPAATFAEASGTLVNNAGLAQRFFQVFAPGDDVRAAWRWLRDMMAAAGRPEAQRLKDLDDVLAAMAADMPIWAGLREAAPDAGFRLVGRKVPRQSHRASGRTAWRAHVNVHEFPPPRDADAPLVFSMEGNEEPLPPAGLVPRFWRPRWNSVQSLNKFQQEIGGILRGGDAGRRLIEPPPDGAPRPYFQVPPRPVLPPDAWHPAPISHVFGSEELSIHSPGIAARAPAPYVGLAPADAAAMGFEEGAALKVTLSDKVFHLPLRLIPGLAPRTVGLPIGLPDLPAMPETESVTIEKGEG